MTDLDDESRPARGLGERMFQVVIEAAPAAMLAPVPMRLLALEPTREVGEVRVRLASADAAVTARIRLGRAMGLPWEPGEELEVCAQRGGLLIVARRGETLLFSGSLAEAAVLPDVIITRGDPEEPLIKTYWIELERRGRTARLPPRGGYRILEAADGWWQLSGAHQEGEVKISVVSAVKFRPLPLLPEGASPPRPAGDVSVAIPDVDGTLAVTLDGPLDDAAHGVAVRVTAVTRPDRLQPTRTRVAIAPTSGAPAIALEISAPRGIVVPVAVGDILVVRSRFALEGPTWTRTRVPRRTCARCCCGSAQFRAATERPPDRSRRAREVSRRRGWPRGWRA